MNLLETPWLPVRREGGGSELIRPWELTDRIESDPVVALDVPRADFNGSLIQFLIGLLQTAWAPKDDIAWSDAYTDPPRPEVLKKACSRYRHAFEFDGQEARFLQDLTLRSAISNGVSSLLIEEPGENTLLKNRDLFVKRNRYPHLGLTAAVAALITLQTNAPGGGQGHRTSLRGGGPLTTLIVPDALHDEVPANLWRLVWLNVLNCKTIVSMTGNSGLSEDSAIFPWLAPTRTSEPNGGAITTPEDAHPLQMYWAMPRRIRLDLEALTSGKCPLTLSDGSLVARYQTRNYGINYEGAWQHPLSPHDRSKDGMMLPLHPRPGGIGYRHWLGLTLGQEGGAIPAKVISQALSSRQRRRRKTRLWAFGFDLDKGKVRSWYESLMPLYHLDDAIRSSFIETVGDLILVATQVSSNLRTALKMAWFKPSATVRGDFSFIVDNFWRNTESEFFGTLDDLQTLLQTESSQLELREQWFRIIDRQALHLFDIWATGGNIEDGDPKRIVEARRALIKYNRSKKIKAVLTDTQSVA